MLALIAAGLIASCSGGTDAVTGAPIGNTFVFSTSGASLDEGGAALVVQVKLLAPGLPLESDTTVDVVDLGNGTATAGVDFGTIGTQVLTFPAGSVQGDTQLINISALVDLQVEGTNETVQLALQNPSSGSLGTLKTFLATINDAELAIVQFASGSSSTVDESASPHVVPVQLTLAAGVSLGVDAVVTVSDFGTGSATSGTDFGTFAATQVTFPAGSLDGDTFNVSLSILSDTLPEIDETVQLGAASPAAGTNVGARSQHTATIVDDDSSGPAALIATAGVSGTETGLNYDDLLDLGSQTLGAGPNAGTRLRLSNAGGSSMALGPPILGGANANDFLVEIELAPLIEGDHVAVHDMATPLTAESEVDTGPGIALSLDLQTLAELESYSKARLHGFPIPGQGPVTLDLQRVPLPFTADALLVVNGTPLPGGLKEALQGVTLWRGSALELPGSQAFVSFSPDGPTGFLELPGQQGRMLHIYTEQQSSPTGAMVCRVVHEDDLLALGVTRPAVFCSGTRSVPGAQPPMLDAIESMPQVENLTAANCVLAIETDFQLYQKFGSVPATTAYVTQLIAAISNQYFTDLQTTISISYLGVYSTASDPWTSQDNGGNASDLLTEFRAAWAGGWPATANLAHFVSGANLGGGIAYVDVLCNQSFGFGVSGNINGNVNWGTWSGTAGSFTWDYVVVAHELGHNFGSSHTQDYCPPLDHCATNCDATTICSQGTLMSYCHLCGGMDNITLSFHQVSANLMRSRVLASCLGNAALAGGDYVQYMVRFNPLSNTGTRNAYVEFVHDAGNQPQPFRVQLQGNAN